MRSASEKFKHLDSVRPYLVSETIPAFEFITNIEGISDFSSSLILRSTLKNEAQKGQLQSGKSLSIGGIDSRQKLQSAWEQINAQVGLEEVILQKEINWVTHITLISEADFFFAELKKRDGSKQFIYWTPLGKSLNPEVQLLKDFLEQIGSYLMLEKYWLMEAGLESGKLHLFQIHPVQLDLLSKIFSTEMVAQIVSSRMKFAKAQSFFGLLKFEWQAWKFRKNMPNESFHPSLIFLNWEFLFHYFRLFCMFSRMQPDAQSFAKFLAMSFEKNWISSMVKKHLELANFFRKNESFDPMVLGFESKGCLFIGKGIFQGIVGEDIHVCQEIPLELIYQKVKPKLILSKEVGLLSHPVLASVENGVPLVLGIDILPLKGARIYLDFDRKILRIE